MCLTLCDDYFRKGTNSSSMACSSLGLVLDQCKQKLHGILRIPYRREANHDKNISNTRCELLIFLLARYILVGCMVYVSFCEVVAMAAHQKSNYEQYSGSPNHCSGCPRFR